MLTEASLCRLFEAAASAGRATAFRRASWPAPVAAENANRSCRPLPNPLPSTRRYLMKLSPVSLSLYSSTSGRNGVDHVVPRLQKWPEPPPISRAKLSSSKWTLKPARNRRRASMFGAFRTLPFFPAAVWCSSSPALSPTTRWSCGSSPLSQFLSPERPRFRECRKRASRRCDRSEI